MTSVLMPVIGVVVVVIVTEIEKVLLIFDFCQELYNYCIFKKEKPVLIQHICILFLLLRLHYIVLSNHLID